MERQWPAQSDATKRENSTLKQCVSELFRTTHDCISIIWEESKNHMETPSLIQLPFRTQFSSRSIKVGTYLSPNFIAEHKSYFRITYHILKEGITVRTLSW